MLRSLFRDVIFFLLESMVGKRYSKREKALFPTTYLTVLGLLILSISINVFLWHKNNQWYTAYQRERSLLKRNKSIITELSDINKRLSISNTTLLELELKLTKDQDNNFDDDQLEQIQQLSKDNNDIQQDSIRIKAIIDDDTKDDDTTDTKSIKDTKPDAVSKAATTSG